jgi:tetratricopeptide (TPR) repeat protein
MMKTTALWTLTMLVSFSSGATAAGLLNRSARPLDLPLAARMEAPPQAATKPTTWSSREEYDAYVAMIKEAPAKLIPLADAFLQKYPNSFMKVDVLTRIMAAYATTNDMPKALDAAQNVLKADPDSLAALRFLSFTFPFLYKADDPNKDAALTTADANAKHGLDLLGKLQKPQGASDADFQKGVKEFRSVFNSCIGFVALQKKDYPSAIAALKAATDDNSNATYAYYWMGLSYFYSTPRDNNHFIWYGARAVALAKAAKDPNADGWEKFLKDAYVNYHGTDTGLSDIENQAAAAANPPDNFTVGQLKEPDKTGNQMVDAFNELTYRLKLGGETAQKEWDGIKGQPIELGGTVMSVEKGTDPDSYLLHIAVLDSTKSTDGYDIELKDTTQPNVKNLQKGDLLTYKGTLAEYTATPSFFLTLEGTVTSELPDKPTPKEKPKPPVHHAPVHKPTTPCS